MSVKDVLDKLGLDKKQCDEVFNAFEDDVVDLLDSKKISDILDKVSSPKSYADFPLPSGTKLHFANEQGGIIFIEKPPSQKTIKCLEDEYYDAEDNYDYDDEEYDEEYIDPELYARKYCLALPYMIFAVTYGRLKNQITLTDIRVYFRDKPLSSANDELYACFLPTMGRRRDQGDISCKGSMMRGINYSSSPDRFHKEVENLIANYWATAFQTDESENMNFDQSHIGSLEDWQKKSKKNPFFILDSKNWKSLGKISENIYLKKPKKSKSDQKLLVKICDELISKIRK